MFGPYQQHNCRTDLHYHVVAGEGIWMPKDLGHPDSLNYNIIFDDKDAAHRTFLGLVKNLSDDKLDASDYAESRDIWLGIVEDVQQEHALEVITYLGMEYHDAAVPIALIACNGCVPYGMN